MATYLMNSFKHQLLSAIAVLVSTVAMAQGPEWIKDAVLYQIYPSTYMDSDGNGIGDLPGITSRLDYIQKLGVTAIWLSPVYESGWMDGGYDVIDFYKVDPRFGTNTDMVTLASEAHKRGIKVCLDLVAGHTSDRNPWFLQSKEGSNLRYSDYFIWTDVITDEDKEQIKKRYEAPDPKASTIGKFVEANAPRAKYYQKNFYEAQPALNYGYANPDPSHPWEQSVDAPGPQAVRQEIRNIMSFWFSKGIDGFRVDLASSLVKNDDMNKTETSKLWKEMREWRDKNFPDRALIAEWFNPKQSLPAGFDIDFYQARSRSRDAAPVNLTSIGNNAQQARPGMAFQQPKAYFDLAGEGSIKGFVVNFKDVYDSTRGMGYFSFPTGSHDAQRVSFAPRTSTEELKVLMTFFLTLPGIPTIYYGDEIGMKYLPGLPSKEGSNARSGSRTPMQWTAEESAGFSSCKPEDLYLPVDTENGRITVEAQENDPNSLLNYVRDLLKLRKGSEALGNDGEWEYVADVEQPYPMIYKRFTGKETYLVAINPSGKKVQATLGSMSDGAPLCAISSGKVSYKQTKKGDTVQLGACSAAVFKLQ